MAYETQTQRVRRTRQQRVMLRAPDVNRAFHLPRLVDAIRRFAREPTSGNAGALVLAISTYRGSEVEAEICRMRSRP